MYEGRARIGRAFGVAAWVVAFSAAAATLALGDAACSGPRYPSCDNDEQCNSDTHKGVCVAHLCTECRDNTQCKDGQECQAGACTAAAGSCVDDKGCESGSTCGSDKRCHKAEPVAAVECDDQHACASPATCQNGHCVSPIRGGPGCTDFPAPKFDYESPELSAPSRDTLQRLVKCISSGSLKGARVLLTGHCDARGEYEFNMGLGAQRAENVKTFVVGLGLPGDKITTSSRGKLDAVGTDEAGWANDRRVDIEVR
jgi:peptidoglycan-associated lipoprotein